MLSVLANIVSNHKIHNGFGSNRSQARIRQWLVRLLRRLKFTIMRTVNHVTVHKKCEKRLGTYALNSPGEGKPLLMGDYSRVVPSRSLKSAMMSRSIRHLCFLRLRTSTRASNWKKNSATLDVNWLSWWTKRSYWQMAPSTVHLNIKVPKSSKTSD